MMQMTIRSKLIGLVGGVALATVAIQLLVFPRQETQNLEKALEAKGLTVVQLASTIVLDSLILKDMEGVADDLKIVLEDKDVRYIMLFGPDGEVVQAHGPRAYTDKVKNRKVEGVGFLEKEEALEAAITIRDPLLAGDHLLVAGLSRDQIEAGSARVWRTALFVGLAVIAIAMLMGLLLGQGIATRLASLATEAEAVAAGELSRRRMEESSQDEIGRLVRSFGKMMDNQRDLVSQITETTVQLNSAAGEFMATAQQQDRGATEQASAVEETRRTLEALIQSGHTIADSAQDVLKNAERTQNNSAVMADHIGTLSEQVQRITEILEVIKGIANKSELLALNAALEGTKAGEAGRGFSLVAGEMQRLAENVMDAVKDIRNLTGQIRSSTQASVLATEESTKMTGDTTRSSRQIAMIIQQQQSGTEQVAAAMDDVSKIATQSAGSAREIVSSTTDILQLCEKLQSLIGRFHLEEEHGGPGGGRI